MKPIITVSNVRKSFVHIPNRRTSLKSYLVDFCRGKFRVAQKQVMNVLNGVSFDIYPGEVVGIMGRNGAGKSTLFRLLTGIYSPDAGQIKVSEKMAALIGLGAGFHEDLTGYENIFLNASVIGFSRSQINGIVQQIIDFSELGEHIYVPVKNYSSGMILRLGFSIASHIEAPVVLLDEILGVGDEGFQRKSLNKILEMIKSGRTVIVVTHDSESVLKYCTRCIVLEEGQVRFNGDVEGGVATYRGLFS